MRTLHSDVADIIRRLPLDGAADDYEAHPDQRDAIVERAAAYIAHDDSCWPFGPYLAQCFAALYREAKESSDVMDS